MSVSEDRYAELMRAILLAEPYRGVCTEPTRLLDHMYIGSQSNAESLRLLRQLRVTHVLNCAGYKGPRPVPNASPYEGLGIEYHEFQAEDTDCYDICRHFPEAFCYLDQAKRRGGIVLVHCALGINRSAAVCLGYMMTHSRIPLLKATKILKDKRRIALANRGFQRQLVRFARTRGLLDELEPETDGRKTEREAEVERSSSSSSSWRDGDLITELLRSAKNELFGGGGSTYRNNHRLLSLDSSSSLKYLTPRYQMTSHRRTSDAPLSMTSSSTRSDDTTRWTPRDPRIYQPTLNGVSTDDRLYSAGRCSRASIAAAAASVDRHQMARGRRSLSTPRTVNGLRPISPAVNDHRRIGSESYSRGRALEFRY